MRGLDDQAFFNCYLQLISSATTGWFQFCRLSLSLLIILEDFKTKIFSIITFSSFLVLLLVGFSSVYCPYHCRLYQRIKRRFFSIVTFSSFLALLLTWLPIRLEDQKTKFFFYQYLPTWMKLNWTLHLYHFQLQFMSY